MGFHNTAQALRYTATLGGLIPTPAGLPQRGYVTFDYMPGSYPRRHNPVGVVGRWGGYRTQGSGVPQPRSVLCSPVGAFLRNHALVCIQPTM